MPTTAQYTQIGLKTGSDILKSFVPQTSFAVPLIGAGVAAVSLALTAIFNRKRPQQKVAASQIADEMAQQLQANVDAYNAGPHTRSSQAAALANFDAAWAWLGSTSGWLNPELGDVGRESWAARQRNGQYPWEAYYRDPIANDPNVREEDVIAASGLPLFELTPKTLIGIGLLLLVAVLD